MTRTSRGGLAADLAGGTEACSDAPGAFFGDLAFEVEDERAAREEEGFVTDAP
jgi:hypothetical protein